MAPDDPTPAPAPDPAPAPAPVPQPEPVPVPKPPPPPGTIYERFWQRSVVQGAILGTVLAVFPALRTLFVPVEGAAPANAVAVIIDFSEDVTKMWAVALGVVALGVPGLRKKT